jgi:hypothetical protein
MFAKFHLLISVNVALEDRTLCFSFNTCNIILRLKHYTEQNYDINGIIGNASVFE